MESLKHVILTQTSLSLSLRDKQFAVVENPGFWNWTFTLKDIDGNVLAEIDRDWRGFGFEVLELLFASCRVKWKNVPFCLAAITK